MAPALKFWIVAVASCLLIPAGATEPDLGRPFREAGVTGTVVVGSLHSGRTWVHDAARAAKPYSPASTFKIPNTLIAVDAGLIAGPDAVFRWDGVRHDNAAWNRDLPLQDAFRLSCVWCYQSIARQVGADRYRSVLLGMQYGSLAEPFVLTRFWLDGELRISALEQVEFLRKLHARSLPVGARAYEVLEQIMVVERNERYVLRAKTGWSTAEPPGVGWYVGMLATRNDVWFFATNIDMPSADLAPLRERVTREALRAIGAL